MNTLLDLITFTKGIEYLLAITFVLAFIGFWQWQQHRGKGLLVRVGPVAVLALAFAGLASTCISSPATATPRSQEWAGLDEPQSLVNVHGPAKPAAHSMGPDIIACQTCHHRTPDGRPRPCRECHTDSLDQRNPEMLGLKAAYHRRCMECHQAACLGPATCTNCHAEDGQSSGAVKGSPGPVAPPAISHPLATGYGDCLACHHSDGLLPLPGNHSGYDAGSVCLGCHKFSVARGAASLTLELLSRVGPPRVAATTGAAKPSAPGRIAHGVAGKENCLACHGQDTAGKTRLSAGHAGRTNGSCPLCHKAS